MEASRAARPVVTAAAGWVALLIYANPGVMTSESFDALRHARTKFNAPQSPPGFSGLWRWIEHLVTGPTPMFVIQTVAFALGAFLLLRRALPARRAAWATAALLVFPPLLVPLSTIWSHSMMSGWLVLGAAAFVSPSQRVQRAGLGALLLATTVQPHALVATLPLCLLLFRWRDDATRWRRIAHALFAWGLITAVALGLTKHYSKKPSAPLWSYVQPRVDREWFDVPQRELPDTALKYGVPTRTTAIQDAWTAGNTAIADHTPLFSPWLYFALAIVLLPFTLARLELLALLIGGVSLYVAYRNPVWLIAATCITAVSIANGRLERRRTT